MTSPPKPRRGAGRRAVAEAGEPSDGHYYLSAASGERLPLDPPRWRDADGGHLNLPPGPGLTPGDIEAGERSLWRYAAAIRVDASPRISLGEGWTPLLPGAWDGRPVLFKLDYVMPTGSFKDRGTSVLLSHLRAAGLRQVLEDSSGNAGASMAAYATAGGLACRILAPASAPAGKIAQMTAMGADVRLIEGDRQAVADAALQEAEHIFYASHNWQPFFLEGTKTLAFELWEQLGYQAPDAVVVPCGYGSNVLGLWLGFNELIARDQLRDMPRVYAVQAANYAPFHAVFASGGDSWVAFEPRPTVADGIAAVHPVRMREVMQAVRGSAGATVAVEEEEIRAALKGLLSRGLFVEPTSAAAGAGLSRLMASGKIGTGDKVVVVLTGSGMKAVDKIARLLQ